MNKIYRRQWRPSVVRHGLGLIVILIFSSPGMAAVAAAPKDHVHQQNACGRCHTNDVTAAMVLNAPEQSCLRCHTQAAPRNGMLKASAVASTEPELSQLLPKQPITASDGMRFPHYDAQSRLGGEPNPMAAVPAGRFIRGTNERLPDEGPQHAMNVAAFKIDIYEVTNRQYKAFIDATGRRSPDHFRNRTFPAGKADHPVTFVTWNDAADYCAWAGKRLPSDVEWEKAARGTDGRSFPWGNEFDVRKANTPVRWLALKQTGDTTPVGAFQAGVSPYGMYDMTGNVWEWTASWYQPYPGNQTVSEAYGERYKTLKGGSWFDCSFYKCGLSAPVYNRAFFARKTKNDTIGFRCAKDH